MVNGLKQVLGHLQQAGSGLTDGQLLGRFVTTRDEAAFAALVRRHGAMVLGVCRRLLPDFHDAEDAFQATFLVLARKAASLVVGESLGCWLYGVAYRTATQARVLGARRRSRERPMNDVPHPEVMPAETHDWLLMLDRELSLLPEKYRAAIVLCDLEGRTRKEAARLLAITEGTLSSRLARGRALLAKRLARCGVALSGGALGVLLAESRATALVSAGLVSSTAKVAALVAAGQVAAVSTTAVLLMKGVMKAMLVKKLRLVAGAVVVVLALGAVGIGYQAGGGSGLAQAAPPDKPKNELDALRRENELLKLNLEVVLEKVSAQEAELRELRARGDLGPPRGSGGPGGSSVPPTGSGSLRGSGGVLSGLGTGSSIGPPMSTSGALPSGTSSVRGSPFGSTSTLGPLTSSGAPVTFTKPDPVQQAEAALKALREAKDAESQRRAADAVEKALKYLKERQDPERKGPRGEERPR